MKNIIIISLLFLFIACSNQKGGGDKKTFRGNLTLTPAESALLCFDRMVELSNTKDEKTVLKFEKFIGQFSDLNSIINNQKKFLTSMGILQRAEIISKNITFSKKADLFYRIRRLIDEKQMGELFKVMLIKKSKNKFKTGF